MGKVLFSLFSPQYLQHFDTFSFFFGARVLSSLDGVVFDFERLPAGKCRFSTPLAKASTAVAEKCDQLELFVQEIIILSGKEKALGYWIFRDDFFPSTFFWFWLCWKICKSKEDEEKREARFSGMTDCESFSAEVWRGKPIE